VFLSAISSWADEDIMNDLNPRNFPMPPFETPQQDPPGLDEKMAPRPD
jgi:hypothetical protein